MPDGFRLCRGLPTLVRLLLYPVGMRRFAFLLWSLVPACGTGSLDTEAPEAPAPPAGGSETPVETAEGEEKAARCSLSPYNCRLESGRGGGHRAYNPRTDGNRFPIGRNAALRDGTGAIRGRVADAAVMVNYGQRRTLMDTVSVYVWNAALEDGGRASGWVRETALRDAPVPMPTKRLPNPGQGDYPTARRVTGGDPAAFEDLTHSPDYDGGGRRASHYLARPGGVVNLFYNVGLMGGISADTFPLGVTFHRARGVRQIHVPMYRPGTRQVLYRMPFVYGQIGGRYGWMAVDAMALIQEGAEVEPAADVGAAQPDFEMVADDEAEDLDAAEPEAEPAPEAPPPEPAAPSHACYARCCDGTLAGPFDTGDAGQCTAASSGACEAHGHVRRIELDGAGLFERARACWAKCRGREAYHMLEGVVEGCTEAARDFCDVGSRGGLQDAAWDACQP